MAADGALHPGPRSPARRRSLIAVPADRTVVTELATALGTLPHLDLASALADRPPEVRIEPATSGHLDALHGPPVHAGLLRRLRQRESLRVVTRRTGRASPASSSGPAAAGPPGTRWHRSTCASTTSTCSVQVPLGQHLQPVAGPPLRRPAGDLGRVGVDRLVPRGGPRRVPGALRGHRRGRRSGRAAPQRVRPLGQGQRARLRAAIQARQERTPVSSAPTATMCPGRRPRRRPTAGEATPDGRQPRADALEAPAHRQRPVLPPRRARHRQPPPCGWPRPGTGGDTSELHRT